MTRRSTTGAASAPWRSSSPTRRSRRSPSRVASLLPWVAMWISSVFVNMAALLAALWFTFGGLGYRDRRVRLGATLLAAAVTFWLQPVVRTIYLGQINLVLMAMIMWDLCQPSLLASRAAPLVEGRTHRRRGGDQARPADLRPLPADHAAVPRGRRRPWPAFLVTVAVGFAVLPHDSSEWWLHGLFLVRRQPGRVRGLGGKPVAARDHHPLRRLCRGRRRTRGSSAAVVAFILGMTAAYLLDRAGYPVPALLVTALTGLLISPISWDHHWVWIALGVAVTGHYASRCRPARVPRRTAYAAVGPGRRDDLLLRRLAGRPVGERAEPRQLLPRLPVGAAQHQPDPSSPSTATSPVTSSTTGTASSSCGATPTSSPGWPCC